MNNNSVIVGIDPGSTRIGYGVIEGGGKLKLLDYGTIEIESRLADKMLLEVSRKINELIKKYNPSVFGIEKIYFSKNIKTGIEVAQTRGAIILEIARNKIPIQEFSPSEIKLAVTNYGMADKKAVAKMSAKILGVEKLSGFDDASDAVATAITLANKSRIAGC